jgi:hypothetical protein
MKTFRLLLISLSCMDLSMASNRTCRWHNSDASSDDTQPPVDVHDACTYIYQALVAMEHAEKANESIQSVLTAVTSLVSTSHLIVHDLLQQAAGCEDFLLALVTDPARGSLDAALATLHGATLVVSQLLYLVKLVSAANDHAIQCLEDDQMTEANNPAINTVLFNMKLSNVGWGSMQNLVNEIWDEFLNMKNGIIDAKHAVDNATRSSVPLAHSLEPVQRMMKAALPKATVIQQQCDVVGTAIQSAGLLLYYSKFMCVLDSYL